MKQFIALAILICVVPFATALHAHASTVDMLSGTDADAASRAHAGTNNVSGIVFFDLDGDGVQGPSEVAAPNSVVNIQEVGSDLIESMITDDKGYFNTGEMPYGQYHVWTEINGQASEMRLIELAELNGTAVIYLPVVQSFSIMLPFVSS